MKTIEYGGKEWIEEGQLSLVEGGVGGVWFLQQTRWRDTTMATYTSRGSAD